MTWPLWQARTDPPTLPAIDLASVSLDGIPFGWILIATLMLVLRWPIAGTLLHVMVLALAIVADQIREQPQVLSLSLLLVATLPFRGGREIGALHLSALWFWSGLGKLTSWRFLTHGAAWIVGTEAGVEAPPTISLAVIPALLIAIAEICVGVLVLMPRKRQLAARLGFAMHLSILVFLSPLLRDWNSAVLPWNAVLAIVSLFLLPTVEGGPRAIFARGGRTVRVAAVLFLVLPIGFHLGYVDAPFAQQVYTSNTCRALVLRAGGRVEVLSEVPSLGIVMPPVPRIFAEWLRKNGRSGDSLIITVDRPLAAFGTRDRVISFDDL